ncbi:universal stress protein [Leptolyngbya sp. FACHB-711]|uniref:universal stress protein n=1 Tax=unclassified Leptolyngbya TaxID=2650499 RepID=UPI00168A2C92|nr:universal stress protein [Leptolyngbya sp. FACHB-711]MBD1851823.1 universal stress protein [Cyanobacteria bacterium FACHB-502]MBD2026709.1 universal stress protein [Leptolyngbya sp. FACHB-711]
MFQRLLICTDFIDGLQRMVHFVPNLAASGIQQITFLHVIPLDSDRQIPRIDSDKARQIRDRLAVAQQAVPDGVEVRIEVQWGRPIDAILKTAQDNATDLILLGTAARSLLTEKLFGSTAVGVCQRTSVPVMVFRPQLLSTFMVEELALRCQNLFRYFLIPYDSSNEAEYLLQRIRQLAQSGKGPLKECLLTWVVSSSGRREVPKDYQIKDAETRLAAAKSTLDLPDLTIHTRVLEGEPVAEILLAAIDYDISAITLSSKRFGKLSELPTPSFAGEMLRRSWHPIIYFPHS